MRAGEDAPLAQVTLRGIEKRFGRVQALRSVSLDIEDGAFVVFVGPSGCGKSTLLRAIAGLESVDAGEIRIGDADVTARAPSERNVAMVFQSYALYPHMTVRENMDFGMKINGMAPDLRARRIAEAARILQLGDYLERKPAQLSGGQRQRVAIGRAIVREPQVFLFDEPLSNLDAKLRVQMRVELEALHRQLGATMVYVTHDQVEAMTMADRIVVLNEGVVEQAGPPLELYHRPRTEFVAGFIGAPSMNFLDVTAQGGRIIYAGQDLGPGPAATVRVGIRPEHVVALPAGGRPADAPAEPAIAATVEVRESLGSETYLHVRSHAGDRIVVRTGGEDASGPGDRLGLALPAARRHHFGADRLAIRN
jgi:ABC-type sugar transport system ATPase subunit